MLLIQKPIKNKTNLRLNLLTGQIEHFCLIFKEERLSDFDLLYKWIEYDECWKESQPTVTPMKDSSSFRFTVVA